MFGFIVFTTLNRDQRKQKTQLSEEIRKKIIDKHVKARGFNTIPKKFKCPWDCSQQSRTEEKDGAKSRQKKQGQLPK